LFALISKRYWVDGFRKCIAITLFPLFQAPVADVREKLKQEVWRFHTDKLSRSKMDELIDIRMTEYENRLYERFASGGGPDSYKISWTFWNAVVYCFTIFTTIGEFI
jgi:hypothetical protein